MGEGSRSMGGGGGVAMRCNLVTQRRGEEDRAGGRDLFAKRAMWRNTMGRAAEMGGLGHV